MKIDIENMARHASKQELRWFVGEQLPDWLREMLAEKDRGTDCGKIIEDLADVCCIKRRDCSTCRSLVGCDRARGGGPKGFVCWTREQ